MIEKRFLWFLAPPVLQLAAGMFVMVPVTTYYLGPADIGVVAILTALAMPVVPLASTGDSWVLSTHWHRASVQDRRELLFSLLLANVSMKAVWAGVFWFSSGIVLPMLVREYRPEYRDYFGCALLGLLASTTWATLSSLMVIERAAATHAVNELLQWLAGALTTLIGLAVANLGMLALFLAPIVAGLTSTAHGWYYVRNKISARLRVRWLCDIARSGLPAVPFSLTDVLANTLDRFVIQRWLDLSSLGIYAHSQNYRGMVITITKAYSKTMTPSLLELFADPGEERAEHVRRASSGWYVALILAGVLVALFSREMIHILTHGKFDDAAMLVPLWFLLAFAHSMGVPFTQYLLSARRNFVLSASSILISAATIVLVVLGTWTFGVVGATAASVFGSLGLHACRYWLARRYGCLYGFEPLMVWGIGAVLGTYLLVETVPIPLVMKLAAAALIAAIAWTRLARDASWRDIWRVWALSRSSP